MVGKLVVRTIIFNKQIRFFSFVRGNAGISIKIHGLIIAPDRRETDYAVEELQRRGTLVPAHVGKHGDKSEEVMVGKT